jgi:hypothetical protein
MSGFLRRQLHEALAPLERMALTLLRQSALAVVALASLFACLTFLSVAGFIWLSGLVGAALAALALAGIYMLIALICLLAARGRGSAAKTTATASQRAQGAAESQQAQHVAAARAGQNPEQQNAAQQDHLEQTATQADEDMRSENIDAALAPILAVLQEAGLQRTNIGVLVAAAVAKQVNPFVLVATAFALGLTFSRRKP